jgi:hypothetical protein
METFWIHASEAYPPWMIVATTTFCFWSVGCSVLDKLDRRRFGVRWRLAVASSRHATTVPPPRSGQPLGKLEK